MMAVHLYSFIFVFYVSYMKNHFLLLIDGWDISTSSKMVPVINGIDGFKYLTFLHIYKSLLIFSGLLIMKVCIDCFTWHSNVFIYSYDCEISISLRCQISIFKKRKFNFKMLNIIYVVDKFLCVFLIFHVHVRL